MLVETRMTRNPITATPEMPVAEAQRLMRVEKIHRLPVLDKEKQLVGIVTEKDILYASPSPANTLDIHELTYLLSKLPVKKVMSSVVVTINRQTTIEEAARIMVDNNIGGLPVMEGDTLVGIITESDLFKVFLELFGVRKKGIRLTVLIPEKPGELSNITQALYNKGADIVSFSTFLGTDSTNAVCTLKVVNITQEDALEVVKPYILQIIDVREV